MASGLQHIDDFFRKKNEILPADVSSADLHWQQMKSSLSNDVSLPAKKPGASRLRPWMKYAAILTIAVSSLYIVITKPWKVRMGKQETTLSNSGTIPVIKKAAISLNTQPKRSALHNRSIKLPVKVNSYVPDKTFISSVNNVAVSTISKDITESDNAKAFNSFYNELKKPSEQFIIDTGKDTTVLCKEGSSLFIPASCFESATGVAINGTVNVYVQEFYSIADIVGNKLTTLSNGQPLITGGMLNIRATANSQEIMIKPGAAINLTMPTQVFDPGMQLFTSSVETDSKKQFFVASDTVAVNAPKDTAIFINDGINWIASGQQQFFLNENKKNITILNLADNPYEVVYHQNKSVAKYRIPFNSQLSTEEIKSELEKRYGNRYDKIKVKREWTPLFKRERIFRHEYPKDWYATKFVGDSITIPLYIARRLKLITVKDSLAYETKWRKEYEEAMQRKQAYSEFLQKRERYNFNISNLGWINCDMFSKYPRSRLADFALNTGDEFQSTYFQAILILDRMNSAIPGYWNKGTISFSRLPAGESVHVICVGAKEGKVFSCVQKFTVWKNEKNTLQFKETTPADFKNDLARFGNVTRAR